MLVCAILTGIENTLSSKEELKNDNLECTFRKVTVLDPKLYRDTKLERFGSSLFLTRAETMTTFGQFNRSSFVEEREVKSTIISYSHHLFKKIRLLYQISDKKIKQSLLSENNLESIFQSNRLTSEGLSSNKGGRSYSFFFFTEDKQYIIKTIPQAERKRLIAIMPKMVQHMEAQVKISSHSMMAPIVGLYNLKIQGLTSVNLLVMKNTTLRVMNNEEMLYKFDLKGSLMKRNSFPLSFYKSATYFMFEEAGRVMKDVDFLFLSKCLDILDLDLTQYTLLMAQI